MHPHLPTTTRTRSRSTSPPQKKKKPPTSSNITSPPKSSSSSPLPSTTSHLHIDTRTQDIQTMPTIDIPSPTLASSPSSNKSSCTPEGSIPKAIRLSPAVDLANLNFKINSPPKHRPVRIYCDGIYDLFHYGHARCLEQAKTAFPNVYLLVGVCNDLVTHARKGKTVMTDIERFESLRHCKWVDEVIENAPWIIDQGFIDHHKIDYVAHDNIPYISGDIKDVYDFVKKQGRFLPTRRTEGISTSDIITRIVRDYDEYLRRNLARGVSPRELNIGFFKEKRLQVAQSVQEIKDEIKSELAELKDEWLEIYRTWETKSGHYIKGFVSLFKHGPDLVVKFLRMKSPVLDPDSSSSLENKRKSSSISDDDDDADEVEEQSSHDDDENSEEEKEEEIHYNQANGSRKGNIFKRVRRD